jgi:hypothetical protein
VTIRTRGRVVFGNASTSRRRRVTLAGAPFSIAAGATKAVKLRLGKAKPRLVTSERKARRVVAIAKAQDAAGNTSNVRKPLLASPRR